MLFVSLASLALVSAVAAQSALPDVAAFPAACASDDTCGPVVEVGVLCTSQYQADNDIAACFCNGGISATALSSCSTCLSSNGASTLGSTLTTVGSTCDAALKSCAFTCDFDTCSSSDIGCQCGSTYLQNIFDCASCNSANGNTGVTLLPDYEALRDSCVNQNYTETPTTTNNLPSPTGQDSYVAPTLTGQGDAAAAESSTTIASTPAVTTKVGSVTTTASAGAVAGTSAPLAGTSRIAAASASSSSHSGSTSAAPTASSSSAAVFGAKVDAYALGAVVSVVLGVAALF